MLFRSDKKGTADISEDQTLEGKVVLPKGLSFTPRFFGPVFVDCLSAAFLSAGFCMAGFNFSMFETDFLSNFLLAALSVAVIALLRLRWWAGPSLLLLTLAAFSIYRFFTGELAEWVSYWFSFFNWAFFGGPYNVAFDENGSLFLLRLAFIFLITLAVFAVIRRLFSFLLLLAASTGFFIVVYIMSRENLSAAICAAAAGLIIALPRMYGAYIGRRGGEWTGDSRAAMQLIAVPVAILSVALSLLIVPEDTSAWRSKWLNDLIYDVNNLLSGPTAVQGTGGGNFSLYGMGFQTDYERLGGPARLKNTKMLTVTGAARPILLRGAVMDYYDGKSWYATSSDGDFRYTRFFWRGYRNEAFGANLPSGSSEAKRLYRSMSVDIQMDITYETSSFTTVFAGGRVKNAVLPYTDLDPFFNMRSELYVYGKLPFHQKLTLRTTVLDRHAPGFDENFLELERLLSDKEDRQYENILSRYTALPAQLPESVINTAARITDGAESPYLMARAIESWLGENFTYTLEPSFPPRNADFVEYFLETKEGYCSYYASAMAVLARCVGLPSRYVTGFALESSGDDHTTYVATGKTAHAWTEIYFIGIGWVEFDPLDWNAYDPLNREAEEAPDPPPQTESGYSEESPPEEEPYESQYPAFDIPSDSDTDSPGFNWSPYVIRFLGIIAALVLIRMLIAFSMKVKFRQYEMNRIIKKRGSLGNALAYYYSDILRQLGFLDIEPRPGETLLTFPARVDKRIARDDGLSLSEIAGPLMRMHFAGESPSRGDLKTAQAYHSALEEMIIEKLGKAAYIARRVVLG